MQTLKAIDSTLCRSQSSIADHCSSHVKLGGCITRRLGTITLLQGIRIMATSGVQGPDVKKVVICGGGIIGAATAYYLAQLGVGATVIERETIAAAASGKAGGFLALDWNDNSPVGPLARRSYALHKQLADTLGRETIGYREVDTIQVVGSAVPPRARSKWSVNLPAWLDGHITKSSKLGAKSTTAQVHPAKLTTALMSVAETIGGAKVVIGTVTGISTSSSGAITGVKVQQESSNGSIKAEIAADAVVLAMGPWTGAARAWLPTAPATAGQKAHSCVFRPKEPMSDTMVFTAFRTADGRTTEPELYPRPDGTVYVCGETDGSPVPSQGPAAVTADPKRIAALRVGQRRRLVYELGMQ
eukprot:GHRR01004139.1.p2 GENE.GHRR01004139.1~~GHRR01004139.1.p2  ORF type:complete len:358 (+),score=109.03 GHRR01004139.1:58-1131(+)